MSTDVIPRPGYAEHKRFFGMTSVDIRRSEEHTSELQSLRHLVCRLLLEKKKIIIHLSTDSYDYRQLKVLQVIIRSVIGIALITDLWPLTPQQLSCLQTHITSTRALCTSI